MSTTVRPIPVRGVTIYNLEIRYQSASNPFMCWCRQIHRMYATDKNGRWKY